MRCDLFWINPPNKSAKNTFLWVILHSSRVATIFGKWNSRRFQEMFAQFSKRNKRDSNDMPPHWLDNREKFGLKLSAASLFKYVWPFSVCVSGDKKCSFFGKFGMLFFSWNTRFEIHPFALLLTKCSLLKIKDWK